jgi:regulator of nonsense transcripts 2
MISFVSKTLLRFPWNDPSQQCGALICKYMMKACRKGRYKVIYAVAAVAAYMRRSRPEVAARFIDAVLEDLQWSIEHPSFRDQQRTITYAKLLGELHSLSLVSGQTVIQQLYTFINFGHEIPEALRQASEKQLADNSAGDSGKEEALPVYNSAGGISQTINEDEEMDDEELETKEVPPSPEQQAVAVSLHSKYDPRVSCTIDLPNSVFRVKLVCTVLDTSAKHLVNRSNIAAVEGFLAAFQRYLFTRSLLPTEVEFALLDTFDVIDSKWRLAVKDTIKTSKGEHDKSVLGFPRYATWLEAHNATVAVEEADAVHDARTRARLESLAGAADGTDSSIEGDASNDLGSMMDEDESVDDQMSLSVNDETDSEIDSQEAEEDASDYEDESQHEAFSEEESLEESESRDTDDYVSEEEEVDEEAYMRQLEEEAFERELRRLTMDALEKGKNTARTAVGGKVADNMPSGSQFIRKKLAESSKLDDDEPVLALGGQEGVSFQLLKKGNKGKMQVKQFVVPLDTNLAKRATKQDDDAAKERDLLKARVLQYEADSAEQGLSGGNVYLEQDKLQFIRNRPLTMDDIDRNFGSTGGNSAASKAAAATTRPTPGSGRSAPPNMKPRSQPPGRGGRGRSGRSLYF